MKKHFETYVAFAISPFLVFPMLLRDIYQRNRASLFLFALLFGCLSLMFIPKEGNDKATYYLLYESLGTLSVENFFSYLLAEKTDFVFYILIFGTYALGIPLGYLFLVLTTLTVWLWLNVFDKVARREGYDNRHYFLFFSIIVLSFSLSGLLSGIRFYFASALAVHAFYIGIVDRRLGRGSLFLFFAVVTHFSCLMLVPFFALLYLSPARSNLFKWLFLVSFFFLLLPRDTLLGFASRFNVSDTYSMKLSGYLGEEDYIENSQAVGNFNNLLKFFFKGLWTYFAYAYLVFTLKRASTMRNIVYAMLAVSNVFYSAPTVYFRYLIPAQLFFILLLMIEYRKYGVNFWYLRLLYLILLLNFGGTVYALKTTFLKSYFTMESLSSISILGKPPITSSDFIDE